MLKEALTEEKIQTIAGMEFHEGKLDGMNVVVVKCSVGKVNAAACFLEEGKMEREHSLSFISPHP